VEAGTVVYLNGPSSSGKHGIVAALQEIMDSPWFNIGIDQWFYNFPAQYIGSRPRAAEGFPFTSGADGRLIKTGVGPYGRRLMRGLYAAVAALAAAGSNVVVDDVMYEEWMAGECARALAGAGAYFVGVRCRREVVEARERARGDRPAGLAACNYDLVHRGAVYDLEVDTSDASAADCAGLIKAHLVAGHPPRAFKLLAR
jgi:chloramphenicol 3-O phosphotransferase